jgi:hypothetical protein
MLPTTLSENRSVLMEFHSATTASRSSCSPAKCRDVPVRANAAQRWILKNFKLKIIGIQKTASLHP